MRIRVEEQAPTRVGRPPPAPHLTPFSAIRWTPDSTAPHTVPVIKVQLVLGFATFALWVYCLVGVITSPEGSIRHLGKTVWLLIVLLFPFIGSIAWLLAGRPQTAPRRSPHERPATGFPEYDRPGRAAAVDTARDEEFLKGVRERAEEQRRRHEEARRERERLAAEERARYRSGPKAVDGDPTVGG
jgi:hypothetical protein